MPEADDGCSERKENNVNTWGPEGVRYSEMLFILKAIENSVLCGAFKERVFFFCPKFMCHYYLSDVHSTEMFAIVSLVVL